MTLPNQNKKKPKYWMTPLYHHPTPGLYYVRFYGPEVHSQAWGWYQASKLVRNYQDARSAFKAWAVKTEKYIREQT